MTILTIEAIHSELDYEQWAPTLRNAGGIWTMLQSLRKKATSPVGLSAYRAYLERCVNQVKVTDVELDEPAVGELLKAWAAFTKENTKALGEQIYSRNPIGVENWTAKWIPLVYDDYRLALNAWLIRATKRSGDRLLDTTRTMFKEFKEAIPCSESLTESPSPKPIGSASS